MATLRLCEKLEYNGYTIELIYLTPRLQLIFFHFGHASMKIFSHFLKNFEVSRKIIIVASFGL